MPVYEQIAAEISYSANWERFASFDPARRALENRKFGLFMSFTRFTSAPADTAASGASGGSAWVQVGQSRRASGNARYFKQVSLHYGNLHTPLLMQVFDGDSLIVADTLLRDGKYHAYTLNFAKTPQALRYVFTGEASADFYGFTLDGGYGLSVDNIAMRGATGTHFNSTDFALNAEMADALNVKLMILEYGGNAVPYLKDEKGIDTYVRQLRAQVRNLRKYNEGVPIIFIGPADMATKVDGEFVSYPVLEPLIAALRAMCQEMNIPYWDTYKAMGGKDAILAWAERDLVAADYVHFSYKGTRIVAEQFVNALLFEYQQYKAGPM
jgi:lysophospholipase L1-like esterase